MKVFAIRSDNDERVDKACIYFGLVANALLFVASLVVSCMEEMFQKKGNTVVKTLMGMLISSKIAGIIVYALLVVQLINDYDSKDEPNQEYRASDYVIMVFSFIGMALITSCVWILAKEHASTAISLRKILKRAANLQRTSSPEQV